MACRILVAAPAPVVALAVLSMPVGRAQAFDDATYRDWKGQWGRIGTGDWNPSKPCGLGLRNFKETQR